MPVALADCVAGGQWAASDWVQQQPAGGLLAVAQPLRGESSTAVRAAIAAGQDISGWVQPPVAAYLAQRRLYGFHAA